MDAEPGRAIRVAHAIRAGGVAINTPFSIHRHAVRRLNNPIGRELALRDAGFHTETKGVDAHGTKPVNPLGVMYL